MIVTFLVFLLHPTDHILNSILWNVYGCGAVGILGYYVLFKGGGALRKRSVITIRKDAAASTLRS